MCHASFIFSNELLSSNLYFYILYAFFPFLFKVGHIAASKTQQVKTRQQPITLSLSSRKFSKQTENVLDNLHHSILISTFDFHDTAQAFDEMSSM